MFGRRKVVLITLKPWSCTGVDPVIRAATVIGLSVTYADCDFGEVVGRIEVRRIRRLRQIKQVSQVIRHRPRLNKVLTALDLG